MVPSNPGLHTTPPSIEGRSLRKFSIELSELKSINLPKKPSPNPDSWEIFSADLPAIIILAPKECNLFPIDRPIPDEPPKIK